MRAGAHPGAALPDTPAYLRATEAFNLAAVPRPAAAVTVGSPGEVRAALRTAASSGWAVRMHTTGHGAATAAPMDEALLIRTRMRGPVSIDPDRRTARIPAGATWGEVARAAAPHALFAPHGSSPLVGAVGYLLRGGLSVYGRVTGVAANSVRAVELVTADGTSVRADAETDPDLLWALRGGGGGFGVVTAVEIGLFTAGITLSGAAYWPARHAEALLNTWLTWQKDAPRQATTSFRMMRLPPQPELPEPLRGAEVVCVDGTVLAPPGAPGRTPEIMRDLLEPLRAVAPPLVDGWGAEGTLAALHAHLDPPAPLPVLGDHMLVHAVGAPALAAAAGPDSGCALTNVELRQLGGALAERDRSGGVVDHFPAGLAYQGSGVPFGTAGPEQITHDLAAVRTALAPWDCGRTVPSLVERPETRRDFDAGLLPAVTAVRDRIDPDGVFRGDVVAPSPAPRTEGRQEAGS
ncbi:MAG TPA: FAD-dependent oxidoreductase [Streptomyces sp.]|uniref:FAD-binding oxidoreductase n=1 Tax=Streptomyces sp. TaxID=1931 RepID=UPI002B5A41A6|nr:FAD-dependent oxidoreductase [Streptomyces sp.]HWU11093.1 FAD-dependent oxidoreductase [Streptomyces sp.]